MNPTIAQQVRDLQRLPPAQLAEQYAALFGKPPRTKNRAFLLRTVAWKLQENALGGLSARGQSRLAELGALVDLPIHAAPPPPAPRALPRRESDMPVVGTVITRRWHDQEIRITVRDDGVEWNGTIYRSLSAAARAITGSAWNGRLFFGLTARKSAS